MTEGSTSPWQIGNFKFYMNQHCWICRGSTASKASRRRTKHVVFAHLGSVHRRIVYSETFLSAASHKKSSRAMRNLQAHCKDAGATSTSASAEGWQEGPPQSVQEVCCPPDGEGGRPDGPSESGRGASPPDGVKHQTLTSYL